MFVWIGLSTRYGLSVFPCDNVKLVLMALILRHGHALLLQILPFGFSYVPFDL